MYGFFGDVITPINDREKVFFIDDLDKWIKQNDGIIVDSFDGSLLDYFMIDCKHGRAFIFENARTAWTSKYQCYFFRENEIGTARYNKIETQWFNLSSEYWDYMEKQGYC